MGSPNHTDRSSVSVEDLLRLKRHEKPDPDFWDQFERDLQRKTLKAAMEQRSFRHQLARGILVAAKPLVGLGAAALVAFGFYLQLDLRAPAEPHAPVASAGQAFTSADAPQVQTPPALAAQVPATPKTSHTLLVRADSVMVDRSASRTSFEADVIPARANQPSRGAYAKDMQPTVFRVNSEQSVIYLADEVLSRAAVRMPTTAHLGL